MPSVPSLNKEYTLMQTGENNGTWGIITNSNLQTIDLNFGGRLSLDVSGSSNVTVSSSQARNVFHALSGTLTGDIDYILPDHGSFYIIGNATTGNYTVTAKMVSGGEFPLPQAQSTAIFTNPDEPIIASFMSVASGLNEVWSSDSPTPASQFGALGPGVQCVRSFKTVGSIVFVSYYVFIPDAGTGSGEIYLPLPYALGTLIGLASMGFELTSSIPAVGYSVGPDTQMYAVAYDGSSLAFDGSTFFLQAYYQGDSAIV